MPRLVVNPGEPTAWEIELKPGATSLGRGFSNDYVIDDPSVSTKHCLVFFENGQVRIHDLGSTNGTTVERARVTDATLEPGQLIHLGTVKLLLQPDGEPVITIKAARRVPSDSDTTRLRIATPPRTTTPELPPTPPPPIPRVSLPAAVRSSPPAAPGVPPPPAPPLASPIQPEMPAGPTVCKFHPKTAARFRCGKCSRYFCDLCVNTMAGRKICRSCGVEVTPVKVEPRRASAEKGFYARLPGAFGYPLRGTGAMVVIVAALLFSALQFLGTLLLGFPSVSIISLAQRGGVMTSWWGFMTIVLVYGYMFAFAQNIIHSTAVGEDELPPLPGLANFWEDLVLPFLQLLGLGLTCFAPAIVLSILYVTTESYMVGRLVFPAEILGLIYLPMAFLATAVLDSVLAANPLQVVPSMLKVPLEYLVTLAVLAFVMMLRWAGDLVVPAVFPRGFQTHSMPRLVGFIGLNLFWGVACVYLLVVGTRILGLLFVTRKERLGWLDR